MSGSANRHEDGDLGVDLLRIEDGDSALDDAVFFHLLDAPPAWRRREPHFLGEIGNGKSRIFLQKTQYFSVEAVHAHNSPFELFFFV